MRLDKASTPPAEGLLCTHRWERSPRHRKERPPGRRLERSPGRRLERCLEQKHVGRCPQSMRWTLGVPTRATSQLLSRPHPPFGVKSATHLASAQLFLSTLRSPAESTVSAIFVNHVVILPRPPTGLSSNRRVGSAQNTKLLWAPSLPIADMETTDGLGAWPRPRRGRPPNFLCPGRAQFRLIDSPSDGALRRHRGQAIFMQAHPRSYSR
jgi:hypothetical protein